MLMVKLDYNVPFDLEAKFDYKLSWQSYNRENWIDISTKKEVDFNGDVCCLHLDI